MEIDLMNIEDQLKPNHRVTIYIVWKYFLYRRFIGKPTDEFSYKYLRGYYDRFKYKILPREAVDVIPHWHTIERAIRFLRSNVNPPFFITSGRGFFKPTSVFWTYIQERIKRFGGVFWPELKREVVGGF